MVILFSPLAGAIMIAYIHLLVFIGFCFCELKKLKMQSKLLRVAMDTLNLVLILIGAFGLNYAKFNNNGVCKK
jgi:uncharacterized membrane protein YsdA (DUF1294 family)